MIIICDICNQYVCPSSCPSFEGKLASLGASLGRCFYCSSNAYENDGHHSYNGKILCDECASELISSELLEYLGCDSIKDFFDLLW